MNKKKKLIITFTSKTKLIHLEVIDSCLLSSKIVTHEKLPIQVTINGHSHL